MFWEAGREPASKLLPPLTSVDAPHSVPCRYRIPGGKRPARIELRMRMRPVGIDVLQDLVDSGDLDPKVIDKMPTFDMRNTVGVWTAANGAFQQTQVDWIREHCVY